MPFFLFNGFLLFGLAALIPVALHLLHKRRPQPYLFAAVRFIQDATAKSRRSRRITQCVTLIMRVLIIIILAMAFAQPLVRNSKFLSEGQRVAVIVIDSSASMQASGGDKSLFQDLGRPAH
jgi:type IV secretory pathway component VirB8